MQKYRPTSESRKQTIDKMTAQYEQIEAGLTNSSMNHWRMQFSFPSKDQSITRGEMWLKLSKVSLSCTKCSLTRKKRKSQFLVNPNESRLVKYGTEHSRIDVGPTYSCRKLCPYRRSVFVMLILNARVNAFSMFKKRNCALYSFLNKKKVH